MRKKAAFAEKLKKYTRGDANSVKVRVTLTPPCKCTSHLFLEYSRQEASGQAPQDGENVTIVCLSGLCR